MDTPTRTEKFRESSEIYGKGYGPRSEVGLTCDFSQEFPLIHAVFEGFAAVDEHNGDFVGELLAQLVVAVDVYFLEMKTAPAMQFVQAFFDHFAKMTPFA
jgi:hypothetical protein